MIPQSDIVAWRNSVQWVANEQVEQDLVISRALVEIFNDKYLSKHLAFRGGTALHKLFLNPQPRYSEDIDLVQVGEAPIGETLDNLRVALSFLGKGSVTMGDSMVTMRFRFTTEIEPVVVMKLKVETNCREHFTEFGYLSKSFAVDTQWFKGTTNIITYQLDELLGTKIRALYQRSKGRDLFDLYKALNSASVDPDKVIQCYHRYMKVSTDHTPSKIEFQHNLDEKMKDAEFLGDTTALLRPDEQYDYHTAYELVKKELIERM